jgi:hypothetical protein
MEKTIRLRLDEETDSQLEMLSGALGFSKEMAAVYAIRLVSACMREGLIRDMPSRAWPQEAKALAGCKVLAFPADKAAKEKSRA